MQDEQTLRGLAQKASDRAAAERATLERDTLRAQAAIDFDMNKASSTDDPKVGQDWQNAAQIKQAELTREQEKTQQLIQAAEKEAADYDRQADEARARQAQKDDEDRKAAETLAAAEAARRMQQ